MEKDLKKILVEIARLQLEKKALMEKILKEFKKGK